MILMISSGEYSDYGVESIWEGPREGFKAAFEAWRGHPDRYDYHYKKKPDPIYSLLDEHGCKQLQYEEINRQDPDGMARFCGLEKRPFLVKVSYEGETTVDAYSEEEARLKAKTLKGNRDVDLNQTQIVQIKELGT